MNADSINSSLIFGGARSGKSAFAEQLCKESDKNLIYVATSPVFATDAEMADRIAKHQNRRGPRWTLIEEQLDVAEIIKNNASPNNAILIDCMTLWLNNLIYHQRSIDKAIAATLEALKLSKAKIVFVSNEVGQGIVPLSAETREFRDLQGRLNQTLAAACDRVIEVKAGLPILLKPTPHASISL